MDHLQSIVLLFYITIIFMIWFEIFLKQQQEIASNCFRHETRHTSVR